MYLWSIYLFLLWKYRHMWIQLEFNMVRSYVQCHVHLRIGIVLLYFRNNDCQILMLGCVHNKETVRIFLVDSNNWQANSWPGSKNRAWEYKSKNRILFNYPWNFDRYDLVDLTRQVLSKLANQEYLDAVIAFRQKDLIALNLHSKNIIQIIKDVDILLASDDNFLLGTWLKSANKLAKNPHELRQVRKDLSSLAYYLVWAYIEFNWEWWLNML